MNQKPIDMPKSLWEKLGARRTLFEDFSNESQWGDGYWLFLAPGYINANLECHFIHEWTISKVIKALKDIEPCECAICNKHRLEVLDGMSFDPLDNDGLSWLVGLG